MTRTGMVLGTPEYMAPEQARGVRALTAAADYFSLGCVLYECLTGQPPFFADHIAAVLVRILFEEPAPVEQHRPGVPEPLRALLRQLLHKDPARRLVGAEAVGRVLDALRDEPEQALAQTVAFPAAAPAMFAAGEQNLFSVVLAAMPDEGSREPTVVSGELPMDDGTRQSLLQALKGLGVAADFLASGAMVVTVPLTGNAADQTVRAARAALCIKERWTAAAVCVATGHGTLHERTAIGEVIEQAAHALRRSSTVPAAPTPRAVFVDELSSKLLHGRFVQLPQPGGALLFGEEKDADASRPLLGKPTPCVGREAEITMLEGQLASCIDESEPRAVLVTAPPGMGKSRLRHEFVRRIGQAGQPITLLAGRGDMMSAGAPYGLLGQVVRALCGLGGGEQAADKRARLHKRLTAHVPSASRERVVLFLGEMSGVPFPAEEFPVLTPARADPRVLNDRIRRALLDWLAAEAAAAPVLVVLDDLQWGDALSLGLIDEALRELRTAPLFVLALGRPEVHDAFPKLWQAHRPQELVLRGLSKRACERLIQQVLGKQIDGERVAHLYEQSAGSALFLEELIRAFAEDRRDGSPKTVLAMLQARIGRLKPRLRRVLLAAAIFGQTSWAGGVTDVLARAETPQDVEPLLRELTEAELLEPHAESRLPGQKEYEFRHALMREAAYALLAPGDRTTGHQRAGRFLEAAGESDALVIAEHAERAGDAPRTAHFCLRAAEQALARHDLDGTVLRVERALRAGPERADLGRLSAMKSAALMWKNQWPAAFQVGQEALSLLRPGETWWCHSCNHLAIVAANLSTLAPLHDLAARFAAIQPGDADPVPYALAAATLVMELGIVGEPARVAPFLALAQRACAGLPESQQGARMYLDCCRAWQILCSEPSPWEAFCCATRSTAYHRAVEDWQNLSVSTLALGLVQGELGDIARGLATLREIRALGERLRSPFLIFAADSYSLHLYGQASGAEAAAETRRLFAALKDAPVPTARGLAQVAYAQRALQEGDLAGAETAARAAIGDFPIIAPYRLGSLAVLAQACTLQGRHAEALEIAGQGLHQLAGLGRTGFAEVPLRLAAAEALWEAGERPRARDELRETLRQIALRAGEIKDDAWRASYLDRNPACARARAVAEAWKED